MIMRQLDFTGRRTVHYGCRGQGLSDAAEIVDKRYSKPPRCHLCLPYVYHLTHSQSELVPNFVNDRKREIGGTDRKARLRGHTCVTPVLL